MILEWCVSGVFSDEFWVVVEPLLPSSTGSCGTARGPMHRRALEGIAWRYRTGSPWRDLPVEFGPVADRVGTPFPLVTGRYLPDGSSIRTACRGSAPVRACDPDLEQLLSVDSTVVRAHQHAAGARRSSIGAPSLRPTAQDHRGHHSNYTNLPVEPADHAIGRSRGGLSTKIHTLTDDRTRPVAVILTAGQSGDNPQLEPLLDLHRQQYPLARRPQFPVAGGQGLFASVDPREAARQKNHAHDPGTTGPEETGARPRVAKGGRPPGFDKQIYAKRNTVERGYLRLKQWRGIATRYDKHALTFLGGVTLAIIVIHLRTN